MRKAEQEVGTGFAKTMAEVQRPLAPLGTARLGAAPQLTYECHGS